MIPMRPTPEPNPWAEAAKSIARFPIVLALNLNRFAIGMHTPVKIGYDEFVCAACKPIDMWPCQPHNRHSIAIRQLEARLEALG